MNEAFESRLRQTVEGFCLPRYTEIPDIGLYLEQAVRWVNRYTPIFSENEITASMISNYVKHHIIPGPKGKTYSRDALGHLLFVCLMKTTMPLEEIRFVFGIQRRSYEFSVAYDYFCEEFENLLAFAFGLKEQPDFVGHDSTVEKELLRSALLSAVYHIRLQQYIRLLKEDAEAEDSHS